MIAMRAFGRRLGKGIGGHARACLPAEICLAHGSGGNSMTFAPCVSRFSDTRRSFAAMADEYGKLDASGEIAVVEDFVLESGYRLKKTETCYKTYGTLNESGNNVIVVNHALTGNADLEAWWGALLGPGKPMDTNKYFIFCANVLGGCYGSTGPGSIDPDTGKKYGLTFPKVTIRDMVQLQAEVLLQLGVKEVQCVIGGSMGGMQALEWAASVVKPKAKSFISLSASGRHSAWQIGISECQRQAIYADPLWNGGDYPPESPPVTGVAVARMMAMVTYRTHPAYAGKFGRSVVTDSQSQRVFNVESYLRYQGKNFNTRKFDACSYVYLTQAMDSHDLERGRGEYKAVLRSITTPGMTVSISSDVLYPPEEQMELAQLMPNVQHHMIQSAEGHDGFILETQAISTLIRGFLGNL